MKKRDTKPVGRPSKYDPKYCEMVIDHMSKGLSFESFAGFLGVNRDTVYEWAVKHKEFSDAKTVGLEKCRLFWEKLGIGYIISKSSRSLNSSVYIFTMKNRFPKEWRDRQEVEHSGELSGFKIEIVDKKPSK